MIGPIDYAKDLGIGFRQQIIKQLTLKGIDIVYLDPTNKLPGLATDVGEQQSTIQALKRRKDLVGLQKLMKKIIRADLRAVDYSDFVIAFIDTSVHMCGSYHEIICALNQSKPTLMVVKGGIQNAPSWLYGIAQLQNMFGSIQQLSQHLQKVNQQGTEDPNWVIIRQQVFKKQQDIYIEEKVISSNFQL